MVPRLGVITFDLNTLPVRKLPSLTISSLFCESAFDWPDLARLKLACIPAPGRPIIGPPIACMPSWFGSELWLPSASSSFDPSSSSSSPASASASAANLAASSAASFSAASFSAASRSSLAWTSRSCFFHLACRPWAHDMRMPMIVKTMSPKSFWIVICSAPSIQSSEHRLSCRRIWYRSRYSSIVPFRMSSWMARLNGTEIGAVLTKPNPKPVGENCGPIVTSSHSPVLFWRRLSS
mmetsp:Transcript_31524/g.74349  ORF Transcript_31524/g.74349 Transcript_31524/m.74349 type:complete len:237 (+) Transcript_31524:570-1280(+)